MKLIKILGLVTCFSMLWGCDDEVVDYALLTGKENLWTVPENGGEYTIQVQSRGTWVLTSSAKWLSLSVKQGQDNGTVKIIVGENIGNGRSAILTLASGAARDTLGIIQAAAANDLTNVVPGHLEIPRLTGQEGYQFIAHNVTYNGDTIRNYSMEYNLDKRHSRWVAFSAYDVTSADNVTRTNPDPWDNDPEVASEYHTNRADYSGYDRGHLTASNDRRFSRKANVQTFYYSNVSPQLAGFNQKIWQKLEEEVKAWMQNSALRDTLYVVKGGTIADDQILKFNGPNSVAVPKFYFMAILARKDDSYKSIAFWLEHKEYSEPYDLQGKAVSVAELEERTGIDFFPALPDALEKRVEEAYDVKAWTWITR